jgi:hypothetical protein
LSYYYALLVLILMRLTMHIAKDMARAALLVVGSYLQVSAMFRLSKYRKCIPLLLSHITPAPAVVEEDVP